MITNTSYNLKFKNVIHIPNLRMNLLFTRVLDDDGYTSYFA